LVPAEGPLPDYLAIIAFLLSPHRGGGEGGEEGKKEKEREGGRERERSFLLRPQLLSD
jgi:hypothetical protein